MVIVSRRGAEGGSAEMDFFAGAGGDVHSRGAEEEGELNSGNAHRGGARVPEDGFPGGEFAD